MLVVMSDLLTRRNLSLAAASLVAIVALVVFLTRPSDEQRVKATLDRLVAIVSVKEGDTVLSRAARVRSGAKEIVDDGVRLEVPDLQLRVTGREAFVDGATKAGLLYNSATAELVSVDVKLDEAKTTAKVDATALVTGLRGAERRVDKRRVHFLLRKDGDWKVTTIDVAESE